MVIQQRDTGNYLLAGLSPADFGILAPHLEPETTSRGEVWAAPNVRPGKIMFPVSSIASVVAMTSDERRIEVGLFGRDGLSAPHLLLGVDTSPHQTFAQVAGKGFSLPTDALLEAVEASSTLKAHLIKYVQTFTTQVAHTALSNGSYKIEERLARWLLMCHDRRDDDDVPLIHEFLALMLGVRRAGVTLAVHVIEGLGAVRAERGLIRIVNRAKLEEIAGSSYGAPEGEYEKILGRPLRRLRT